MFLDDVVAAQNRGEPLGAFSICSAHPWVLKAAMRMEADHLLIESTCNQVNQFGGYTGMTPADFAAFVRRLARENGYPPDRILLGGDHLGPNVWQSEPATQAMAKAQRLVQDVVTAGYSKIHLDCSMKLADDPAGPLAVEVAAKRAAHLARVAEDTASSRGRREELRYVIGTEVPVPGGATEHEESVRVTAVEDVRRTIEVTQEAFRQAGLEGAWDRVIAVVVQPGVEFGNDFVLPYDPAAAAALSQFIEPYPFVYEAHSTDYQTQEALQAMVRDHFAILKVGPALTFAFREGVFALALIEEELYPSDDRSRIMDSLDESMQANPLYWRRYYHGDGWMQALERRYSFSDRIRYYWHEPNVHRAFHKLLRNLSAVPLPLTLLSQYLPAQFRKVREGIIPPTPEALLLDKVMDVLAIYDSACRQGVNDAASVPASGRF